MLAKSPHLRCAALLPLPEPHVDTLIAYEPLMEMSASQGVDVDGAHLTVAQLKQLLSAWLPAPTQRFSDSASSARRPTACAATPRSEWTNRSSEKTRHAIWKSHFGSCTLGRREIPRVARTSRKNWLVDLSRRA